MRSDVHCLHGRSISEAWSRALLLALKPGVRLIAPLTVTIDTLDDVDSLEDPAIRTQLDHHLALAGSSLVHTVANTIFPLSYWNKTAPRQHLYDKYLLNLPTIKKMNSRNRYGLYFERLIAFGPDRTNQLEHIITTYMGGNHRKSALQAAIFDPSIDHTNQRQRGFPCLQQVAFTPDATTSQLAITGFYATQYLDTKAYGNYLGLYRLGRFMAHELGLVLSKLTCVASAAELSASRKRLRVLARNVASHLGADGLPSSDSRAENRL